MASQLEALEAAAEQKWSRKKAKLPPLQSCCCCCRSWKTKHTHTVLLAVIFNLLSVSWAHSALRVHISACSFPVCRLFGVCVCACVLSSPLSSDTGKFYFFFKLAYKWSAQLRKWNSFPQKWSRKAKLHKEEHHLKGNCNFKILDYFAHKHFYFSFCFSQNKQTI